MAAAALVGDVDFHDRSRPLVERVVVLPAQQLIHVNRLPRLGLIVEGKAPREYKVAGCTWAVAGLGPFDDVAARAGGKIAFDEDEEPGGFAGACSGGWAAGRLLMAERE